eukprot:1003627-Pelagomonas_calceolata.AAC.6
MTEANPEAIDKGQNGSGKTPMSQHKEVHLPPNPQQQVSNRKVDRPPGKQAATADTGHALSMGSPAPAPFP